MADTLYIRDIEFPTDDAGRPLGKANVRALLVRDTGMDQPFSGTVAATSTASVVTFGGFTGSFGDLVNKALAGTGVAPA